MKNILIFIFICILHNHIFSQLINNSNNTGNINKIYSHLKENKFSKNPDIFDDEVQIKSILNSIEQGIRQHKIEYILPYFAGSVTEKSKIEGIIQNFFFISNIRKNSETWISLTPDISSKANWDFTILKPTITVNNTESTVTFDFYWLMNIPITKDEKKYELFHPNIKKHETWTLIKSNEQWYITNTNLFLDILKNI